MKDDAVSGMNALAPSSYRVPRLPEDSVYL